MTSLAYSSGGMAVELNSDGSGFIYYPNGSTAVAIATASDYQNSYYAFDKDRKASLLAAIDEKGVGFIQGSRRKSATTTGGNFVLGKTRGTFSNAEEVIEYEWKWERKSASDGDAPAEIVMQLNENVSFKITAGSRSKMQMDFDCDGVKHSLDVSIKVRRSDNYLTKAKRGPGGQLVPQIDHVTLKQRTTNFNEMMKGQRNKVNPKSENLSDMVRDIVAKLENSFDDFKERTQGTTGLGKEWKTEALNTTLGEVPRIPISGAETGPVTGFGSTLYMEQKDIDLGSTLPANLMDGTKWKGDVQIREALNEANPPMQRTFVLKSASGRYSNMLVIDPKNITAQNPTGMVTPKGLALIKTAWGPLKAQLDQDAAAGSSGGALKCCLIARRGDPTGCAYERVAELASLKLAEDKEAPSSSARPGQGQRNFDFYQVEVGKDSTVISDLDIRSLPTFAVFRAGRMIYAGPMGGRMTKGPAVVAKQTCLIIEPTFKYQITMEKTLRKLGCDTFLTLNAAEAVSRVQSYSLSGNGRAPRPAFDYVLISERVQGSELDALFKKIGADVTSKRTIVAGLVEMLGERGQRNINAVQWDKDFTTGDVEGVVAGPLAKMASIAIQTPVKAASMRRLKSMQTVPVSDSSFGLTPVSMLARLDALEEGSTGGGTRGPDKPYVGMRLEVDDIKMGGIDLVSKTPY